MQFQSLNSPPHDDRSIPWDSVVLPLGTPGGVCARGSQRVPVSWFGLRGHSLGAIPQPRLRPRQVFIARSLADHGTHTGMYYGWLEGLPPNITFHPGYYLSHQGTF